MKYKAIIFDFDDTLVESRRHKWAQHKHVAKNFYDIDLSDDDIRKHYGKPFNELIGILYQNSDTFENMYSAVLSVKNNFLKQSYQGVSEMIESLSGQGIEIGILSAANSEFIKEDLIRLNFSLEHFFIIQGADHTSFHKPNPKVFDSVFEILSQKGINKKDILYIGDSLDDFQASRDAGIDFIGVATGLYSKEDFQNLGANIVLSNINEIYNFL